MLEYEFCHDGTLNKEVLPREFIADILNLQDDDVAYMCYHAFSDRNVLRAIEVYPTFIKFFANPTEEMLEVLKKVDTVLYEEVTRPHPPVTDTDLPF